jgi:hypothetical protein
MRAFDMLASSAIAVNRLGKYTIGATVDLASSPTGDRIIPGVDAILKAGLSIFLPTTEYLEPESIK